MCVALRLLKGGTPYPRRRWFAISCGNHVYRLVSRPFKPLGSADFPPSSLGHCHSVKDSGVPSGCRDQRLEIQGLRPWLISVAPPGQSERAESKPTALNLMAVARWTGLTEFGRSGRGLPHHL